MSEIKENHIKQFEKIAKNLDNLMKEILKYNPEAEMYAEDCWNLNLMKGPTHTNDKAGRALQANVVACVTVRRLCGGSW